MRHMIVLLSILLLLPDLAQAQWTNEPPGSVPLLECAFTGAPSTCGISDIYGTTIRDSDAVAPISPPGVSRSTLLAGNNNGGSQLEYNVTPSHNEMYIGLMWRTNPQFEGRQVGNKTFFVGGASGAGVFLFGNAALVNGTAPLIFGHNSSTIDNSHTCAADLGLQCYPNVGSGIVTRGVWTKVEVYVKDSTTRTSRDGILRWWINGVLAGNYTNYNWWAVGFNTWKWTETWDGTVNPVPTVDWSHYIDHLHISIPNCGTSGCGGGGVSQDNPPGPPGIVTGFGATAGGVQ